MRNKGQGVIFSHCSAQPVLNTALLVEANLRCVYSCLLLSLTVVGVNAAILFSWFSSHFISNTEYLHIEIKYLIFFPS